MARNTQRGGVGQGLGRVSCVRGARCGGLATVERIDTVSVFMGTACIAVLRAVAAHRQFSDVDSPTVLWLQASLWVEQAMIQHGAFEGCFSGRCVCGGCVCGGCVCGGCVLWGGCVLCGGFAWHDGVSLHTTTTHGIHFDDIRELLKKSLDLVELRREGLSTLADLVEAALKFVHQLREADLRGRVGFPSERRAICDAWSG